MKKLLSIIVLGFLLSGNAYAAKPSVDIIDKNENYIILLIKNVNANDKTGRKNITAWKNLFNSAISHCKNYNKDPYLVFERTDQNNQGWALDEREISQTTFLGSGRYHIFYRFHCEKNPEVLFKNFNQSFGDNFTSSYNNFYNSLRKKANQTLEPFSLNVSKADGIFKVTDNLLGLGFPFKNFLSKKEIIFREAIEAKENILRAKEFENKDQQFNYVCVKQLNLKKSTKKFNDCVYKIMTMELELAKINAEKEIAIAKAEAARANQLLAEEATEKAVAEANSQKFKKNISNLLVGLLVLGEINQASQQATNFKRTFTCTPTGFASGLQYSVNCY